LPISEKTLPEQSTHDKEMLPCDKERQAAETSSMGKVLELSALYMLEKCKQGCWEICGEP